MKESIRTLYSVDTRTTYRVIEALLFSAQKPLTTTRTACTRSKARASEDELAPNEFAKIAAKRNRGRAGTA